MAKTERISAPEHASEVIALTPAQKASQRKRSIAIALTLLGLVLLFYAITIIKVQPQLLLGGS